MPGEEREEGEPGEEITDQNRDEGESYGCRSEIPLFVDGLERFEEGENECV